MNEDTTPVECKRLQLVTDLAFLFIPIFDSSNKTWRILQVLAQLMVTRVPIKYGPGKSILVMVGG